MVSRGLLGLMLFSSSCLQSNTYSISNVVVHPYEVVDNNGKPITGTVRGSDQGEVDEVQFHNGIPSGPWTYRVNNYTTFQQGVFLDRNDTMVRYFNDLFHQLVLVNKWTEAAKQSGISIHVVDEHYNAAEMDLSFMEAFTVREEYLNQLLHFDPILVIFQNAVYRPTFRKVMKAEFVGGHFRLTDT